jgi:hypothetical protein
MVPILFCPPYYLVLEELVQIEQNLRHLGVLGGADADLGRDLLGPGLGSGHHHGDVPAPCLGQALHTVDRELHDGVRIAGGHLGTVKCRISSICCCQTSSMLTPPSLLAMQQGPFIDRSFMKAM